MALPGPALVALLAAGLAPAGAAADRAALAGPRVLVEAGLRATAIDYVERGATGVALDGESGIVPALDAAVEARLGPVALRARGAVGGAELRYAGLVQSPSTQLNGLTASSASGAHLAEAGLEVAVALPRARGAALVAGAELRRWDRSIHDTTVVGRDGVTVAVRGLSEAYRWGVLRGGLRVPLVDRGGLAWDAEALVTRTWRPRVIVDWGGRGVRLPLGERTGWSAGTAVRAALGPVLTARLGFALERWDFGASGHDASTGLWEPRSTTRAVRYEAGLGARF